jgi:hypothetical protein
MSDTTTLEHSSLDLQLLETITLTLSKTLRDDTPLTDMVKCTFSYLRKSENHIENVQLVSLNNMKVNISMNPIELQGILGFMSSIQPTLIKLDQQKVYIHLVILYIPLEKSKPSAAILFNKDGTYIQTTKNWRNKFTSSFKK